MKWELQNIDNCWSWSSIILFIWGLKKILETSFRVSTKRSDYFSWFCSIIQYKCIILFYILLVIFSFYFFSSSYKLHWFIYSFTYSLIQKYLLRAYRVLGSGIFIYIFLYVHGNIAVFTQWSILFSLYFGAIVR